MKRLSLALLLALNAAAVGTVHAEKADSTKRVEWEADDLKQDDLKQVRVLTGNVVITRGTMVLRADKVTMTADPAQYLYIVMEAAPNKLVTMKQKRDGGQNLWMDGHAERVEYDEKTEKMKLISKAQMRQLNGNEPSDQIDAEFISYDSRAEYFSANNTNKGESKAGAGRIKGSFVRSGDGATK